ncbi:DNA internalization-related competence protein ComEC/Rec2 [Lactobacillus sp. ESL0731]|uniref:DNA internalization-related competence protein ComEC/Rec2 n=1 Tax=unclassified Lactobacillus TaxID=2620435 RepID=UPI0023F943A6|nr:MULTISPECIES: DNA internalization-related competence protein ComEC/Rec2 [unclassified Lactobacillus]WEV52033.1 DNA internalization-related competence protein ComEC/Rec2 [Lactobacillus sp. ESL0700]WEV63162.1 DNA internalization-related competence protein ComEC/Rec2 [Lactobacillus sp. ESL0731]
MRRSKTNWQSELLTPGFFLLTALLGVDLSFGFYQSRGFLQQLTWILLASYLGLLLLQKFGNLKWVIVILLVIGMVDVFLHNSKTNFALTEDAVIKIYPDQVKVDDDWLSGIGSIKTGKVLVSGTITNQQINQLNQGQSVYLSSLVGDVKAIEPATNYGQFDSRQYYAGKNIWQQVKFKSCRMQTKTGNLSDYFHYLRFKLQSYFRKMPRILGFFSSELLLGENPNQDNQQILDNYRDLGVIHILSISGLHVGIYALLISTLCYYLKFTEEETFVCCLIILLGWVFLSNGQAGFVRASLTYLLGKFFNFKGWQIKHFDLLGLTCLVHLLVNPRLMMGVGAILTYTLALGLEMTDKMTAFKQSAMLNLLLTPLLLVYFFQFNLLTVLFNMLIVPYFNWVVMPLTFINLVVFSWKPNISRIFEAVLNYGEQLIGKLSATKIGLLTFGKINWWQCLFLLVLTAIILVKVNEKVKLTGQNRKLTAGLGLTYLAILITIHFPLTGQVTFIDVGQGDSILITTPLWRHVYMIDVGGKLNFGGKKLTPQVNKITIPLLKAEGISQIDGLFVSHQDADHVGDLGPFLEQMKVKKLYMAQGLINNPSFQKRISGRIAKKQIVQLLAGMTVPGPLPFHVVYPFKPGLGTNDDSLSLTFTLADKSWLFTGDLGQKGEQEIMAKYGLHADYFKLGHHGSKTASNPDFLQKLHPAMVFISAGRDNRFGHPHPETLATLEAQHIPWASTQDCGMITWTYGKLIKPKLTRFIPVNNK